MQGDFRLFWRKSAQREDAVFVSYLPEAGMEARPEEPTAFCASQGAPAAAHSLFPAERKKGEGVALPAHRSGSWKQACRK